MCNVNWSPKAKIITMAVGTPELEEALGDALPHALLCLKVARKGRRANSTLNLKCKPFDVVRGTTCRKVRPLVCQSKPLNGSDNFDNNVTNRKHHAIFTRLCSDSVLVMQAFDENCQ